MGSLSWRPVVSEEARRGDQSKGQQLAERSGRPGTSLTLFTKSRRCSAVDRSPESCPEPRFLRAGCLGTIVSGWVRALEKEGGCGPFPRTGRRFPFLSLEVAFGLSV